jgi:eukaryotic-like serine/threonine-protein kinase
MTFPILSPEYVVVRYVDGGGQADVYELRHAAGGRYAGRVLREAWDPVARDEFRKTIYRQLRAAGPRVVPVLAFDADGPQPFMVLEYMPNGSLADEILRRPGGFPLVEALSIAESLAHGLADAHAKDLMHGDFKPGNVLKNAAGTWKLNDFGSAVTVDAKEILRATRWVGTPAYAAPEQFLGRALHASDVYALGVVLFELLTGSCVIDFGALVGVTSRHGQAGAGLSGLIARLTAREPQLRPSAPEAIALLRDALRRATPLAPPPAVAAAPPVVVPRPTFQPAPMFRNVSPAPPSLGAPGWLKAAGLLGAFFAGAAVVSHSMKTWDEGVGRYRGSNGKFRGGGLFE